MAKISLFEKRRNRVRSKLRRRKSEYPRLSVHRSNCHIYAQIIDDKAHRTLAAASSLDQKIKNGGNCDAATRIGKKIAEKAQKAGVKSVVFDRGGFLFHGRLKALAEAAREGGLEF